MTGTGISSDPNSSRPPGTFRQLVESLVLLGMTVMLFRLFAAEGYLISTGSMAPTLLGYHRQVVCPECRFEFARGASIDESALEDEYAQADASAGPLGSLTICPNCGCSDIPCAAIPRNQGDQLLVHKHAYEFHDPKRWEVVVFQNATDAGQAYVKRLVGLPGETIEIRDGNVYANGLLMRKPLPVQRAVRLPVYQADHPPDEKMGKAPPRWRIPPESSHWQREGNSLLFRGPQETAAHTEWVAYHHWIRSGGQHVTQVQLSHLPAGIALPPPGVAGLTYDPLTRQLGCSGVLSQLEVKRCLSTTDDLEFADALLNLERLSHLAPVVDNYGYNVAGVLEENRVRELQLEFILDCWQGEGHFDVAMSDGAHRLTGVLNFRDGSAQLMHNDDPVPVARGSLPKSIWEGPVTVMMSLFDKQAILTIDGEPVLPAFTYADRSESASGQPALRLGASGLECEVSHLSLYRDIYYTAKPPHGTQPVSLSNDEMFVLGDNSPVSMDSRVWDEPAIKRSALIGKPLVVHLPSRQKDVSWGSYHRFIRVPDWTRIRYIR